MEEEEEQYANLPESFLKSLLLRKMCKRASLKTLNECP